MLFLMIAILFFILANTLLLIANAMVLTKIIDKLNEKAGVAKLERETGLMDIITSQIPYDDPRK